MIWFFTYFLPLAHYPYNSSVSFLAPDPLQSCKVDCIAVIIVLLRECSQTGVDVVKRNGAGWRGLFAVKKAQVIMGAIPSPEVGGNSPWFSESGSHHYLIALTNFVLVSTGNCCVSSNRCYIATEVRGCPGGVWWGSVYPRDVARFRFQGFLVQIKTIF